MKLQTKPRMMRCCVLLLACLLGACLNPKRADQDSNMPLGWLLGLLGLVRPAVFYVSNASGSDSNSGRSVGAPFQTIGRALEEVKNRTYSVIKISGGGAAYGGPIALENGTARSITLAGGYRTDFSARNPYANLTTIAQNTSPATVSITGGGPTAFVLDGLQILSLMAGANTIGVLSTGGAVVTIRNCSISGGVGTATARSIHASSGTLTVENNLLNPSSAGGLIVSGVHLENAAAATIVNNLIVTTIAPTTAYGVFVDAATGPGIAIKHNTMDFFTFNPSGDSVGIHYVNTPPEVILYNAFNINGGGGQRFGIDTPGVTAATNDFSCGAAPLLVSGSVGAGASDQTPGALTLVAGQGPFYDANRYIQSPFNCIDSGGAPSSSFVIAGVAANLLRSTDTPTLDTGNLDIGYHYNPNLPSDP